MPVFQVKCYWLRSANARAIHCPIEIKRFAVNQNAESYEGLIGEIYSHFKDSFKSANEIKSYWIDEEGDLISFSSNEELSAFSAYSQAQDKVLRVFVVKQEHVEESAKPQQQPPSNNMFEAFASVLNNPDLMKTVGGLFETVASNIEKEMPKAAAAADAPKDEQCYKLSDQEIEERVKAALEQMKQMGFTNENDCLTKLLRDNQGNINPVLDIFKSSFNFF